MRSRISLFAFLIFCIAYSQKDIKRVFDRGHIVTWADAEGYYMYLPAAFIYNGFRDVPQVSGMFPRDESTGLIYNKFTYGVAILQAPFFLLADTIAPWVGYPQDGFSMPYQKGLQFAALAFLLLGFKLLYRPLKEDYGFFVAAFSCIAVYFGTNLLHYSSSEAAMSHVYSFFLLAALIHLLRYRLYDHAGWRDFLLTGLVGSLIIFIRPSNAVMVGFAFSYGIRSWPHIIDRASFFLEHWQKVLMMPVFLIIFAFVQISIWSYMRGDTTIYSYDHEPKFIYWMKPRMLSVLFSHQNGLFIYAPILLLAMIGLVIGIRRSKINFTLTAVIFIVITFIFGSWWAWWFGGAFGHRCYVEYLALLIFPLAYLIDLVVKQDRSWFKIAFFSLTVLMTHFTIRLSNKYQSPWDGPDWTWYTLFDVVKTLY